MDDSMVKQFLDVVPALVDNCIYYEEDIDTQYKQRLASVIKKQWNNLPDYDFQSMYEEICDRLEELSHDGKDYKRYVYSLITPFKRYSDAFYGAEAIRLSQENIDNLKNEEGSDGMIHLFEEQIKKTEQRNEMFFERFHTMEYELDETEDILFELANGFVCWYANALDGALAANHINLETIQNECGVWVKQILSGSNILLRAPEISEYVGSFTLAEKYLKELIGGDSIDKECKGKAISEECPSCWVLNDMGQNQRFSLENVNYGKLYKLLVDYRVMNSQITSDYFAHVVQRAQFGRIYKHCDTTKGKFRLLVKLLSNHTTDSNKKKEYQETAAHSMGIVKEDGSADLERLGKFNVVKTDKFRIAIERILQLPQPPTISHNL